MSGVKIEFKKIYEDLLLKGLKTTTLRNSAQASEINLKEGYLGNFEIQGVKFQIHHVGLVHVDEVGGRGKIFESEGFTYTGGPKFQQTQQFLDGEIKLHLYRIEKIGGSHGN